MSRIERLPDPEPESDEEDLSEMEQRNLDNILVLFPHRKRIENNDPIDDETFLKIKNVLTCPVCLDIYKDPVYIKKCLHRFCRVCIEKVIRSQDNKTCPACRMALGSKRLLRNDKFIEQMIKMVFSNLKEFQQKENQHYQNFYRVKTKEFKEQGRYQNRRRNTRSSGPDVSKQERMFSPMRIKKEAVEESKQEKTPIGIADRTRKALEVHKHDTNIMKKEIKEVEKPKKLVKTPNPPKIEKLPKPEKPKKIEKEPPKPRKETPNKKPVIEINDEGEDDIVLVSKDTASPRAQKKRKQSAMDEVILIDDTTDVENFKRNKIGFSKPQSLQELAYTYPPEYYRAAYSPYFGGMPPMNPMNPLNPMSSMMYPYMNYPFFSPELYSSFYSQMQPMQAQNKQLEAMLKNTPSSKTIKNKNTSGNELSISMLSQKEKKEFSDFFSNIAVTGGMQTNSLLYPQGGK